MQRAKRLTPEQERQEVSHRHSRIIQDRVLENGRYFKWYVAQGFRKVWEAIHEKPMPAPDLTLEYSEFISHLGMDVMPVLLKTELELALESKIEREEAWLATRRRIEKNPHSRRVRMLYAQVRWGNRKEIRHIYKQCKEMNAEAGYRAYHVDHIIPIAGKLVCGLHVVENLRIITAVVNLKKNNYFDPEGLDQNW